MSTPLVAYAPTLCGRKYKVQVLFISTIPYYAAKPKDQ